MNIVLLEPFYTGSHASWAEGLAAHSRHRVEILELSGSHWKWRMHGGAVTLAERFLAGGYRPDFLLATDMLDMGAFLALTRKVTAGIPTAIYFHENQLTYPWSPKDRDKRRAWDRHYSFINFVSALACDRVFFNSRYHMNSFLEALPVFLRQFPDHQELGQVAVIRRKCEVLPLGFDLHSLDAAGDRPATEGVKSPRPLVLWNHRWEYDKNPEDFFAALQLVAGRGRAFDVALVGEVFDVVPAPFLAGASALGERIIHSGYVASRREYAGWLWRSHILPVTSNQDFFGGSVLEAMYCGCFPILPRRLAYPELIPEERYSACFYEEFDELVEKLDEAVCNFTSLETHDLREAARRYDWRDTAPLYDERFEAVRRGE
ncbi:MAG: DUF3524 domain-containing protein [Candidatus Krumholzibacteria bacterium]